MKVTQLSQRDSQILSTNFRRESPDYPYNLNETAWITSRYVRPTTRTHTHQEARFTRHPSYAPLGELRSFETNVTRASRVSLLLRNFAIPSRTALCLPPGTISPGGFDHRPCLSFISGHPRWTKRRIVSTNIAVCNAQHAPVVAANLFPK